MIAPEFVIEWGGQDYTIKPTMRLLRKIENEVSLAGMLSKASANQPQVSHVAYFMYELLKSAGADVSEAELYQSMYGEDMAAVNQLAYDCIVKCMGNQGEVDPKKAEGPSEVETPKG